MASQWTLIWLLLLSLTIVVFAIDVHNMNIDEYLSYVNPPAVHKFRNEHGDNILCVLYADQISLRVAQVVVDSGGLPFYQVSAQLNVWKPNVDTNGSGIFSASQIWARNEDGGGIMETVLAGWEVHPSLYGDTNPRFFVDWVIEDSEDGAHSLSGCENTLCPGFVLASGSPNYLGSPISPVSTYEGNQEMIDVEIVKENRGSADARWSVYVNNDLLGWWPTSMFTFLSDNAVTVGLGGEVLFYLGTPSSKTEMGSGHFPDEGFRGSAHVSYIQIAKDDGVVAGFNYKKVAPRPKCYDVSDITDGSGLGTHFFFGGPGGDDADCAIPSTF